MADKFDPVFASGGAVDTDERYLEYAENGLVDEALRHKAFNKIVQLDQQRINDIIDELPTIREEGAQTLRDGYGDAEHVLGVYSEDVCFGERSLFDRFSIGSDIDHLAHCIKGGQKKILVSVGAARSLIVFDVATEAIEETVTFPSSSLPSGTWNTMDLAADATYIYVAFRNTSSNDIRVQSYAIADWTANPGWPSTGTLLFNSSGESAAHVINANDDNLAYLDPTSNSGGGYVYLLGRSSGAIGSGGNGGQGDPSGPLASNGTTIFTAAGTRVLISSPSLPGSINNWPINGSEFDSPEGVACIGRMSIHTLSTGLVNYPVAVLSYLNQGRVADLDGAWAADGDIGSLGACCTDGRYFYARASRMAQSDNTAVVVRIDPRQFTGGRTDLTEVHTLTDKSRAFAMTPANDDSGSSNHYRGPIIFDGRDIWTTHANDESYLYRLAYAASL